MPPVVHKKETVLTEAAIGENVAQQDFTLFHKSSSVLYTNTYISRVLLEQVWHGLFRALYQTVIIQIHDQELELAKLGITHWHL
jgi:hypothetical protein